MDKIQMQKLCDALDLGNITESPKQVYGGLLHKTFRIATDSGVYAIKMLNPSIMRREHVLDNYHLADHFSSLAHRQGIRCVPAIFHQGYSVIKIGDLHFQLFQWVDGASLAHNEINEHHCREIGKSLSQIHGLHCSELDVSSNDTKLKLIIDWDKYMDLAAKQNTEWINKVRGKVRFIQDLHSQVNQSLDRLRSNLIVSHRDLDPKNVLWSKEGTPIIIDWESSGLINPTTELVEVALYWSKDDCLHKERFRSVVESYLANGGTIADDFEDAVCSIFNGKLGWLEYCMKKSLAIEANTAKDIADGTSGVYATLADIEETYTMIPSLLKLLQEI